MGDVNQKCYLEKFLPAVDGPILEVGSKDYGSEDHGRTMPFRETFPLNDYIGVDLEAGKGVDRTLDLVEGIGDLPENHFALVICCSVMEHVTQPWKMADNITRLVRPDGKLYISVPWIWRYHAYPDDYYRFSFRGIMQLFPEFTWAHIFYSTTLAGEFLVVKENCLGIDNILALTKKQHRVKRKYMPCLMLNMLGTKQQQDSRQAA
jgi:SAM-dependent methyltransferase